MISLALLAGGLVFGAFLALRPSDTPTASRPDEGATGAERPAATDAPEEAATVPRTTAEAAGEDAREATNEQDEPRAGDRRVREVPVRRTGRGTGSKNADLAEREEREPSFDAGALKGEIEGIFEGHSGRFGAVVYDPESGQRVEVGGNESFYAASVGKLPALMTLYEDAARGEVDLNDEISIQAEDVAAYGTGELYLYGVGYALTLRECAWYLVNKSDNTAWAMLNRWLGFERIRAELGEIGATSTNYEDAAYESTPNDVLKMLERISDPAYTNEELSREMLDAMTDTAFEDRIPAALPEGTRVAHKIGTYGTFFHDAGVVYYKDESGEEKRYYVVVMSGETVESEGVAAIKEVAAAAHGAIAERQP